MAAFTHDYIIKLERHWTTLPVKVSYVNLGILEILSGHTVRYMYIEVVAPLFGQSPHAVCMTVSRKHCRGRGGHPLASVGMYRCNLLGGFGTRRQNGVPKETGY